MAVLPWPTGLRNPNSARLALGANTQSGGRSPFDGTEQTLELPGSRWMAELRWQNLPDTQWRILQAFIANLGGRAGRFNWSPSTILPRKSTCTGTITVAAGSAGKVLQTTGWGAGNFVAGDTIGYTDPTGRQVFHMLTVTGPFAGGTAALSIAPPIRRMPANGAAVTYTAPTAVWMLASDDMGLEYERGVFASCSLTIQEAIF